MSYQVGIDLGATYSAAAVCRPGHGTAPELVPLSARSALLPSVVFASPDGSLLIGDEAERLAPNDSARVARRFTARIGDGTPLRIGGLTMTADEVAARVVSRIVDLVAAREGATASRVTVTHPAGWGQHRVVSLRAALSAHGLGSALLLSEPLAAVQAHAAREPLDNGAAVAVYDLGGGGFEAAVVRKLAVDRFTLLGRPEELEVGGPDFDEVVFEHVRAAVGADWEALDPSDPAVLTAVAALRRACVTAKEALSSDTDVLIPVVLPGIDTVVRLARAEFDELIHPAVDETVAALLRAVGSAGLGAGDLAAVLLVGGCSRMPLVTQEVSARLGRPVSVAADPFGPKGIVAIGAALAARSLDPRPVPIAWGFPVAGPSYGVATPHGPDRDTRAYRASDGSGNRDKPAYRGLAGVAPAAGPGAGFSLARPPMLTGSPPPPPRTADRWRGPGAAAAAVLAALAVAGGVAVANRAEPAGADADPVVPTTVQEAGTVEPPWKLTVVTVPSTAPPPQPAPTVAPRRTRSTAPAPTRVTTTRAATTTPPTPTGSATTGTAPTSSTPAGASTTPATGAGTAPGSGSSTGTSAGTAAATAATAQAGAR